MNKIRFSTYLKLSILVLLFFSCEKEDEDQIKWDETLSYFDEIITLNWSNNSNPWLNYYKIQHTDSEIIFISKNNKLIKIDEYDNISEEIFVDFEEI